MNVSRKSQINLSYGVYQKYTMNIYINNICVDLMTLTDNEICDIVKISNNNLQPIFIINSSDCVFHRFFYKNRDMSNINTIVMEILNKDVVKYLQNITNKIIGNLSDKQFHLSTVYNNDYTKKQYYKFVMTKKTKILVHTTKKYNNDVIVFNNNDSKIPLDFLKYYFPFIHKTQKYNDVDNNNVNNKYKKNIYITCDIKFEPMLKYIKKRDIYYFSFVLTEIEFKYNILSDKKSVMNNINFNNNSAISIYDDMSLNQNIFSDIVI